MTVAPPTPTGSAEADSWGLAYKRLVLWSIKRFKLPLADAEDLVQEGISQFVAAGGTADGDFGQLLKGIVLSTLLGVGSEISFGSERSDLVRAIRQSTQQNVNQAGQRITEKNLNIQPTITVRPGWPLRVIVHKDLILKPYRQ